VFQKELYNVIPNVAVWRVLRKRLHLKMYKLSIIQGVKRWIVCTPLIVNVNTRHTNIWNATVKLIFKHPELPVEVT
jgi:hypothetical protein